MSVAISVLVPVYNVENTLDRCLKSILNQTFKNFEIILVNDGSTDNSGNICDEYAQKYENISVIHKENEGLGPTRNAGIRAAKGEYIYHCDSDDWLKEDLLEKAYAAARETDAEVVVFGYDIFTEKGEEFIPFDSITAENGVYVGKDNVQKFFAEQYFNSFFVLSACNRVYKRSFLIDNEIYFPPLRRCQDMAYSMLLFDNVEHLTVLKETFYCYVIEPGVFKGRAYEEMLETYCTIYNITAEYFEKWGLFAGELKQRLTNQICEHIANYSAFAFVVKFKGEKKNIKYLLGNKDAKGYFKKYKNIKKSKFMALFCFAMRLKSAAFMLTVCKLVRNNLEKK